MRYDAVVVGAGVSGMSAALLLAGCGRRVALVEKSPRPGAMIRGFVRQGLQFDTGFHYAGGLGEGEPLDLILRCLGLSGRLHKEGFADAVFDIVRIREPEFEFSFPAGRDALRQALHGAFPGSRKAVDGYLALVEQSARAFPFMNLEAEGDGPDLSRGPTLRQVLDGLGAEALLHSVLSVHCFLYGVPPLEASFALHAAVVDPYYRSAGSFKGGGRSLAQAFDDELARQGVDLYCGQGVTAIELDASRRLRGVRLADERFLPGDTCVATLHPCLLPGLLPTGALRPVYCKRLQGLEESPAALLLYGAKEISIRTAGRPANLFLLPSPAAVDRLGGSPAEGPVYVSAASAVRVGENIEGFMAIAPLAVGKTGGAAVLGARPPDYAEKKQDMAGFVGRHLEKMAPELWRGMLWTGAATPFTLRDYGNSPCGSLYGARHRVGQTNPHTLTRVPGLLLAGQGVAAPGILGAMISAIIACQHIVGHEHLRDKLRACR